MFTEQTLCACATGWKIKRNHDIFPHGGFNSLRGITLYTSNNDQISQKSGVWQGPSSWHFAVCSAGKIWSCQCPVPSLLGVEKQLQQWQKAQFSDEAIVVVATAAPWSLNSILGSVPRFFFFGLTVQVLAPWSPLSWLWQRKQNSWEVSSAMFRESHLEVRLEPTPPFLPTIL